MTSQVTANSQVTATFREMATSRVPGAGVPLGHQTVPGPLADHRPTALAAWHIQLELLALHLEGDGPCWPEERTEELRAYYARRLT